MAAVKRSRQLLRGMRWQLAIPYAGLVATRRLLELAKTTAINSVPARWAGFNGCFVPDVIGRSNEPPSDLTLSFIPPRNSVAVCHSCRFYAELVEIPLLILIGGTIGTLLLARLQDVLPYAAYTQATAAEGSDGNGGSPATAADMAQQDGSTPALPAAEPA
jgi:hypothetical protein